MKTNQMGHTVELDKATRGGFDGYRHGEARTTMRGGRASYRCIDEKVRTAFTKGGTSLSFLHHTNFGRFFNKTWQELKGVGGGACL